MSDIGATTEVVNDTAPPPNLDAELDAIFDRNHVTNGADRGDRGKFVSPNPETPAEGDATPSGATTAEAGEGAGAEGAETTLADPSVPLPANMRGLESEWTKIPPDAQAAIAPHLEQLHKTLSDQGQVVAAFKPLKDVIDGNADIFGRQKEDGSKVVPADIVSTLIGHQRIIERDLVQGIVNIAGSYNVTPKQLVEQIVARMNGNAPDPVVTKVSELEKNIPALIERHVSQAVAKTQAENHLQSEVDRWSDAKDKPFAKTLLQDDNFVPFITMARAKLGDAAQLGAVLDRAYDMAVNADPDLRAKAAAAKAAVPAADPKRVAEARRAAEVNVTSTSTGKSRTPSLDDELSAVWEKNHKR